MWCFCHWKFRRKFRRRFRKRFNKLNSDIIKSFAYSLRNWRARYRGVYTETCCLYFLWILHLKAVVCKFRKKQGLSFAVDVNMHLYWNFYIETVKSSGSPTKIAFDILRCASFRIFLHICCCFLIVYLACDLCEHRIFFSSLLFSKNKYRNIIRFQAGFSNSLNSHWCARISV